LKPVSQPPSSISGPTLTAQEVAALTGLRAPVSPVIPAPAPTVAKSAQPVPNLVAATDPAAGVPKANPAADRTQQQPTRPAAGGEDPNSVAWLHQRIMTLQRERETRWQKILKLLPGNS
jgi:hypothetical protein